MYEKNSILSLFYAETEPDAIVREGYFAPVLVRLVDRFVVLVAVSKNMRKTNEKKS